MRNKRFGDYVRRRRAQREWTQEQMAAEFKPAVTAQYVSKLESGVMPDSLIALRKVAEVFGDGLEVVMQEAGLLDCSSATLSERERDVLDVTRAWSEEYLYSTLRWLSMRREAGEEPPVGARR